jgi:hypothetical protein
MVLSQQPTTPSDRTILITYLLTRGAPMTICEVMHLTGLTRSSARRLLIRISFMAPVYDGHGVWRILSEHNGTPRAG